MTARIPPPIQEPFVDTRTGLIRRVWYDFLQNRDTATGLIDSLTTAKIWIGSAVNLPAEQSMSGDATLATNGALTLATVNSNTGTFGSSTVVGQFTVGGKGLITAASSVPIVLPSTAISDFTEAAQDAVGAMVDTTIIYNDTNPTLTRAAITGDVTVAASSNVATLSTVNSNIGTFGSATAVAQVTVSSKGLVTAASTVTIAIPSTQVTDFTEASQDAVGAMVDSTLVYTDASPFLGRASITGDVSVPVSSNTATLSTVNSNIGTFGSASAVAQVTVSSKGLVTAASTVTIAITGSQVTDFTEVAQDAIGAMVDATLVYTDASPFLGRASITGDVSIPVSSNTATLATVNSNIGSFGSSTTVARITVSSKGLITAVSSVSIVYDSANFTGTNWTDLTDAGATTLHKHDHGGLDGLADDDHTIYYLADGTRAGTGDHDFSGATSLKIPVSTVPTMDASGKIALDTSVTSWVHGLVTYNSTSTYAVMAMPFGSVTSIPHGNLVSYTSSAAGLTFVAPTAATTVTVADEATDTTCFPLFVTAATGDLGPKSNLGLTYNSNTNALAVSTFTVSTLTVNGNTTMGDASGDTVTANAGTVVFAAAQTTIRTNTPDGSDTSSILIAGGGGSGNTRGAMLSLYGNEAIGATGSTSLATGDVAGAQLDLSSGTAVINLFHNANVTVTGTNLSPSANDGAPLGTTALQWSDLFLAEGGVINWDNGDATLTQTGNVVDLAGAAFMIGDTSNANNTAGLTINQGAADDHAVTLKSSDVATGLTTVVLGTDVETDDYFTVEKLGGTGGVRLRAMHVSSAPNAFVFEGHCGAPSTTDTSASVGALVLVGTQHDGANAFVDMAANSNLFTVHERDSAGSTQCRLLLKADDGELHLGNTTLVALDNHDDLDLIVKAEEFRTNWQDKTFQDMKANSGYDRLVEIGLLGNITEEDWNAGHRPLMSAQRAIQLVKGEARQKHAKFEAALEVLEESNPAFRAAYNAKLVAKGFSHLRR